jgi:hypothetical protein
MRRGLLLILATLAFLIVLPGATATAQPGDGLVLAQDTEPPADEGVCEGLVWGVEHLCGGVTGVIGSGTEAVVAGGAKAALSAVVEFVVDGSGWLLGELAGLIDRSTRPDVTSGWFQAAYRDMAAIALVGLLPFLLLAIIQGIVRQDPGQLLRSTFVHVPLAAIGTGAAVVIVDMLITITDGMSTWIGRSMGSDLSEFATGLGTAVTSLAGPTGGGAAGFAALIAAAVVAFATFVIWLELLLRQAAIYVAVLFLPLGFMAMVWPATAHWLRRLVQGLVAIILSKFVIVAVMALASSAMNADVGDNGFGVVVAGGALLSLAALAPYVLLRLIPVFEAGLSSQFEGTFRRPTAAVAPPGGGPSQITRMIRQRVGSGGAGGGSPQAAFAGAGTGGSSSVLNGVRASGASGGSTAASTGGGTASAGATAGGAAAAAGVGLVTAGAGAARSGTRRAAGTAEQVVAPATNGAPVSNGRPAAAPSSNGNGTGHSAAPAPAPPVADTRRIAPPSERPATNNGGES